MHKYTVRVKKPENKIFKFFDPSRVFQRARACRNIRFGSKNRKAKSSSCLTRPGPATALQTREINPPCQRCPGVYYAHRFDLFRLKYSTPEAHAKFKLGVETLQDALATNGFRPKSTDLLITVPGFAVDEFWVAPWMLSFDPNVSVKGGPSKKRLLCFGLVC